MKAQYSVYRNLHTGTFSLKYKGKVIEHPTAIVMVKANFVVSEKGRQRVLATRRKNVHATVRSSTMFIPTASVAHDMLAQSEEIYYNPYKTEKFMCNGEVVENSDLVLCFNNKLYKLREN